MNGRSGPRTSSSPPVRHKGSILVVDDEDIMREILDALLTREGYHVRMATSGARRN